jgi:hypothetical protein
LINHCRYTSIALSDSLSYLFPQIQELGNPYATNIVKDICSYLQIILTANVLYRLIRAYNAKRPRNRATKLILLLRVHGSILVILFIVSVVFIIVPRVINPAYSLFYYLFMAGDVVFLTVSMEILFEILMIVWKRKDPRPVSKVGRPVACCGSFNAD